MKRRILALAALVLMVVFALPAFSAISTPIVRINLIRTATITQEQLDETLAKYKETYGDSIDAATVLDLLVAEELMKQGMERDGFILTEEQKDELLASQRASFAQELGVDLSDDELFEYVLQINFQMDIATFREYVAQQYLTQQYIYAKKADMLSADVTPTTAQVEAFYRQYASVFISNENVKLAHVYFRFGDDKAAALEKATNVSNMIKTGAISFEKAVTQYSEDEDSNKVAGDIGWLEYSNTDVRTGMGDNFVDEVFKLDAGEVSGVIESTQGYHIVKVSVHNPTTLLGIDDPVAPTETMTVRDYITSYLAEQNFNTLYQNAYYSLVSDLKSEASIKYLTTV